ncbi:FIMAH domain-containing protein [Microbacterium sp. F51-2R]|uniref:FIMAH domain-containing protein n=1 Tax=Microbacterium sp. F51-2R TaxID=3445777 RepID=UPI003F9EE5EB
MPANTTAEVWVPTGGDQAVLTPPRATFDRTDGDFAVYTVGAGEFTFLAVDGGYADLAAAVKKWADEGKLSAELAANLLASVEKAVEQSGAGKAQPADSALRAFLNHIGNANAKRASEEAKADLTALAEGLQAALREAGGIPAGR